MTPFVTFDSFYKLISKLHEQNIVIREAAQQISCRHFQPAISTTPLQYKTSIGIVPPSKVAF